MKTNELYLYKETVHVEFDNDAEIIRIDVYLAEFDLWINCTETLKAKKHVVEDISEKIVEYFITYRHEAKFLGEPEELQER